MPRSRFSSEYELLLRRLIEARKSANITQQNIAAQLNKPQSHVSKCESQEREINIVDLRLWCSALGFSMSDFIEQWEKELAEQQNL